MLDPATQEKEIIQTVESLCGKWLQCSREEEREELARQVGVISRFLSGTDVVRGRGACRHRDPSFVHDHFKREKGSRRRRASLRHVLPSTARQEDAVEIIELDLAERQQAACAQLEEALRWKPWLSPNYEEIFHGTRLALGGPQSCQELPPTALPTLASTASATLQEAPPSTSTRSTAKKKRCSCRCHTAQHSEVSEGVPSPQVTSEWKECEVNTDLAGDMASNELLTKPQSRDISSQSIVTNSLNFVGTSESTHRLKETSTDSHVDSVSSGMEGFPFVSFTMSEVPSKSELSVANVSLPESALLLHQSLNEGNDSITQSLVKVMSEDHVQNKGSNVPELTGSQATPFFDGPTAWFSSAFTAVQPGASITAHPASAAGCPGVPTGTPQHPHPFTSCQQGGPKSLSSLTPRQLGGPRSPSSLLPHRLEGPRGPFSITLRLLMPRRVPFSISSRRLAGLTSPSSTLLRLFLPCLTCLPGHIRVWRLASLVHDCTGTGRFLGHQLDFFARTDGP
ncbi:unnamed protein product [Oreochromis niloticus]|nr:unnamed protein product [Mustela putorius furo]